jgi:peptidoglycan/xylan/chitin deacetylase (PgdA/CDA1 family)
LSEVKINNIAGMMRIDRTLSLYVFNSFSKILKNRNDLHIPILMYHSISDVSSDNLHPYYEVCTFPEIFNMHMHYLDENNYSIINLKDAINLLSASQTESPSIGCNVVITFDDGYKDFYTQAFPILKKYDFSATVFLPTAFIGKNSFHLRGKEHMNWDEVRELHRNGIKFGSHTVNHPQLEELKKKEVEYELKFSKEIIEDKIGDEVDSFSYPFAFPEVNREFVSDLKELLVKSGYKYGVCTKIGTATPYQDAHFLSRIPVNSYDDNKFFKAKLEGDYDWVYKLQYLFKKLKEITNYRKTMDIRK